MVAALQNLDFDFEKCCSVSLSPVNVYACLVCGKYFQVSTARALVHHQSSGPRLFSLTQRPATLQGRGPNTHAYTHSLEHNHHMFMKLANGKVCDKGTSSALRQRQHYVLGPGLLKCCCSCSTTSQMTSQVGGHPAHWMVRPLADGLSGLYARNPS